MQDPNELIVENDVPTIAPVEVPIIPTAEELAPLTPAFNDAAPEIDPDAPYGRKADGTPAKKRGRKSPNESGDLFDRLDSVTQSTLRPQREKPIPTVQTIATDYRPVANLAAGLWFGVPQVFLGEDWKPEKDDEPLIAKAFHDYFKAKGIAEIDPGVALLLVLGSYTAVRVNRPTIKERVSKWFQSMKGFRPWKKR